ncbi:MAG: gamma-glutamyltransferase, partial [Pseudomonadota bacterium]
EALKARGISKIEVQTPHAANVPGAVDAWVTLNRDHGKLPFARLVEPAIDAAKNGFAVAPRVSHDWAKLVEKLSRHEGSRKHLLVNGKAPKVGSVMRMPAFAATLERIAKGGAEEFYKGATARDLVATLAAEGGFHTAEDFARQLGSASYVDPIGVAYRGIELHELPPSNQGVVALMVLKILERFPIAKDGPTSIARFHLELEAARHGYAARDVYLADPDALDRPLDFLWSDRVADEIANRIDMKKRKEDLGPPPKPAGTDTTCLSVVDKDGMAVSFINSLFSGFGSAIVGLDSGVTLQNRGTGFVLTPGHPNAIGPGKRPLHTLVPAMAMKQGKPWIAFNVMGGAYQALGHVHVLTNRHDYGLDIQEACDHPRVFFEEGPVLVEAGVPQAVRDGLKALGHPGLGVREDPWGGAQAIEFDHTNGTLWGGSDPRKDGCALGY